MPNPWNCIKFYFLKREEIRWIMKLYKTSVIALSLKRSAVSPSICSLELQVIFLKLLSYDM